MLGRWDELPIHQTPETLDRPASSDPAFYERFFFSFFDLAGEVMVGLVVNIHPNKGIADANFSVSKGGVHESVFVTAERGGQGDVECGPLTLRFVDPMRVLHLSLAEVRGFSAEITLDAVCPGIEEPRVTRLRDNRVVQDRSRYVQLGRPRGHVSSPLGHHVLEPATWFAGRDHSWGIWDAPTPHARPRRSHDMSFLWLIGAFDDVAVQGVTHADERGTTYGQYASSVPSLTAGDPSSEADRHIHDDVAFTVEFPDDRWHLVRGVMTLDPGTDRAEEIAFRSLHVMLPHAVGYDHPRRSYGTVFADLPHVSVERWDLGREDLLDRQNHRALQAVELRRTDGTTGYGVVDQRVSLARHRDRVQT